MPSFDGLPGGGRNVEQFFNAVVGEGCDCVIVADVGANDISVDQVVVAGDDRFAQLGILALPRTVTSGSGNIGLERPIWGAFPFFSHDPDKGGSEPSCDRSDRPSVGRR